MAKLSIKHFSLCGIFAALILLAFTSCENFLNGAEVKDQITDQINYNNAPSFIIKVENLKGAGRIIQPAEGEVIKKVTDTFSIKFEPSDNHKFFYWEAISQIPLKEGESINDYVEFKDKDQLETEVKFKKASSAIIIRPVCPERLELTRFNMDDADRVYERDSTIILDFNKPVSQPSLALIDIKIPGIETEKKSRDYFKDATLANNTVSIPANVNYDAFSENDLIPVAAKAIQPVSVEIPSEVYYINEEYTQPVKVELETKKTLTYYINSKTQEQTSIQFALEDDNSGHYYADGDEINSNTNETIKNKSYSVGQQADLRFRVSDGWTFLGWKITRKYKDENGADKTDVYTREMPKLTEETNFVMYYGDDQEVADRFGYNKVSGIVQATLTVTNYKSGTFIVEPETKIIPTATITVDGLHGKFSPSKGVNNLLEGTTVSQMFEPDGDYEFVQWEIVDANNGYAPIDNGVYINISDPTKEEITYTLEKAPNQDEPETDSETEGEGGEESGEAQAEAKDIALVIRPKVLERPQIISNTPLYDSSGTYRDVSIMVMFDNDMDENSIYFTDDEVTALKTQYGLVDVEKEGVESDFLKTKDGRIYGYRKPEGNSKVAIFKNIQLTNNRTGESLTKYFDAPIFTDKRTLLIPANKENPVPPSTTVFVVLAKDFYFTEPDLEKPITMREAKKWVYYVNSSTDNEAPVVVINIKNWRDDAVTGDEDNRVIINGNLDIMFNVYITDNASGIPDFFTMNLIDASNGVIVRTYNIDYSKNDSNKAYYKGANDSDYKAFNLDTGYVEVEYVKDAENNDVAVLLHDRPLTGTTPLTDGNYNLEFIFKDKNENTAIINPAQNGSTTEDAENLPYCITLDTTVPKITNFNMVLPYDNINSFNDYKQGQMQFNWSCSDSDYVKAEISYKKTSEDDTHWANESVNKEESVINYTKTITGLKDATNYDFKVDFYDQNDNITSQGILTKRTVPAQIVADGFETKISGTEKDEITVSWKKPADECYTGVYIFVYKNYNNTQTNELPWGTNGGKIEIVRTDPNVAPGGIESYTITGLSSATDYLVSIYAYDESNSIISSRRMGPHLYTAPVANDAWIDDIDPEHIWIYLEQEDFKDGVSVDIYKGSVYDGNDPSVQTVDIDENNTNILFEATPVETIESKESYWTDASLTPGEKYYYKIVPKYHDTERVPAYLFTRTQTAEVENLQVVSNEVTTSSIKISWDKPQGKFAGYSVTVDGHIFVVDESQNDKEHPEYVIAGLEGGKSYSYSVRTNAFEDGWESVTSTKNATTAPNPVPAFTIAKGTGKITVNYTRPQNNYDSIEWWLAPANQGEISDDYVKQTPTSYAANSVDITLPAGDEFFIKAITKYNGQENESSSLYFTSSTCIVSNIRVTAVTDNSISIAWDNPENGFSSIEILNSSGTVIDTLPVTATSWEKTDLSKASRDYYKIRLVPDQNGVTAAAVSTPYIYTNPNVVTDVSTAQISGYKDRITITYHKPLGWYGGIQLIDTSNNSVIATYSGSSSYNTDTSNAVSITCTGFKAGQKRTFKFRTLPMVSAYGSSCDTAAFSQYTKAPVVTNVSATINSPTSMTINWTLPSEGVWNGLRVWYYNQTTNAAGEYADAANASSTSRNITVTPGNYYKYYVTTLSEYDNNWSNTGDYYIRAQPAAVTSLNCASADKTANSLYVTWTKPSGYYDYLYVYYKKHSDSSYTQAAKITNKSITYCTISGLDADTSYDIKVKTNIQDNSSANYNNETIIQNIWTKPLPCSDIEVETCNYGDVKVSWTRPSSTYYRAKIYYEVWDSSKSAWVNQTYYTWMGANEANYVTPSKSNFTNDKKYRFLVYNSSSNSGELSVPITKEFYSAAPKPTSLSVWSHDGSGYQTIRFWMPGTTAVTSLKANIYIDGVYDNYLSFTNTSSGTYVYYKLGQKIAPTTGSSATKKIAVQVYNTYNSGQQTAVSPYQTWAGETYSEILETDLKFNPNLRVDGQIMYYTCFANVINSNTTITGSGSTGAFTSGRTVTLTPYSMAKAEVTEGFYNMVMNGSFTGDCYKPVTSQTYYEAITFCNRLSIKLGLTPVYKVKKNSSTYYTNNEWLTLTPPTIASGYWESVETDFSANGFHLPTECQWEFAARGGSTSATDWNYTYAGSNTVGNVAWYETNSGGVKQDGYSKSTNRLGIYGMSGNVYEMTNDYWVQTLPTGSFTNPTYNYSSSYVSYTYITCRGGSFNRAAQHSEVKNRNWYTELNSDGAGFVGFRICRNVNY